jgi:hypothetical protein
MSASFVRHFTLALLVLEPAGAVDIPLYLAYVGAYSGGWSGGPEMEPAVIMAFEYVISCCTHHLRGKLPTSITRCVVPHSPGMFGRTTRAYSLPPSHDALSHTRRKCLAEPSRRAHSSLRSPSLTSLAQSLRPQGCERRSLHPTWVRLAARDGERRVRRRACCQSSV